MWSKSSKSRKWEVWIASKVKEYSFLSKIVLDAWILSRLIVAKKWVSEYMATTTRNITRLLEICLHSSSQHSKYLRNYSRWNASLQMKNSGVLKFQAMKRPHFLLSDKNCELQLLQLQNPTSKCIAKRTSNF